MRKTTAVLISLALLVALAIGWQAPQQAPQLGQQAQDLRNGQLQGSPAAQVSAPPV